jgi:DNA invertase Pin-like site-specific DNA recombinase
MPDYDPMQGFVAYYRVSTDRQGQSGLGLDAQRAAVAGFVGARELIAEFTEVESGKRNDRPQLAAAMDQCRRHKDVLLIAKLDRLARNVAFIANLMESGVEFVAVDMPYANKLTMHILAAVAEHEREMISARTKAALAQAKARGVKLGRPDHDTRHMHTARSAKVSAFRATVLPEVQQLIGQGMSRQKIAVELNRRGLTTYTGKPWRVQHVSNLLASQHQG